MWTSQENMQPCVQTDATDSMKTKKALFVAALSVLGLVLGCWLSAPPSRLRSQRISAVNSVRQVGLEYRQYRNDMSLPLTTGAVSTPVAPAQ
jgi:hypothetical protein